MRTRAKATTNDLNLRVHPHQCFIELIVLLLSFSVSV